MTFQVGGTVRIMSGFIGGGRIGTVVGVRGDVHTVEFSAPRFIFEPSGEQEIKRLPHAASELEATDVVSDEVADVE